MRVLKKYPDLVITIIGAIIFFPVLGNVHLFDWDEINFAEAAREMIVSKNYLTVQFDYSPFWEKPPLFIWMQVISMKLFGINEFAARFPNAVCGIITLLVLFRTGKRLVSQEFGLWWALAFAGSILPMLYFTSGIIDPWFNLFIFLGTSFIIQYHDFENHNNTKKNIALSALFIGLAILTKGPAALLIFGLTVFVYFIISKFKISLKVADAFIFIIVLLLVGGAWFILQILNGNMQLVKDFIVYQVRLFSTEDAGHGGFFGYHFVVLLLGVFPASVFALKSFYLKETEMQTALFRKWMLVLFWVVFILFSIVKTKIIHYSSLCYFPLTFLCAYALHNIIRGKNHFSVWQKIALIFIAFIFSTAVILLPLIESFKQNIIDSGFFTDRFAADNLQAKVHWGIAPFLSGIIFITCIACCFLIKNIKIKLAAFFVATVLFSISTRFLIVPGIEGYTQRAAIEFYQSKKSENCYIHTWKFKSYAHLFYSEKRMQANPAEKNENWLLTGKIDKPVYFITKITREKEFTEQYPEIQKLYQKNGFVFFGRKP